MKLFNIILLGLTIAAATIFISSTKQSFSSSDLSSLPESDTPVIVELFTSQGCSSCPPADRVAEALVTRDNLYVLSCHVTYWDYIGWKDTLGSPACDNRQRSYSAALKNGGRVYTPQMLINGSADVVGSRGGSVVRLIAQAQKIPTGLISLSFNEDKSLNVTLPSIDSGKRYQLRAFFIKKEETTAIGRGENRNATVRYVQNVTGIYDIGNWEGNERSIDVPLPLHLIRSAQADEIIILANENGYGTVRAVGRLRL